MDRATQERWRKALEEKGVDAVRAELDLRPGRDTDLVYGLCEDPPYPTRGFCDQWCRGEYGHTPILAKSIGVAIVMGLLVVACFVQVIDGWSKRGDAFSAHQMTFIRGGGAPPPRGPASASDDTLQNTAMQNADMQNSSVISSADPNSLRSACSRVSTSGSYRTVTTLPACEKTGPGAPGRPAAN